MEARRDSWETSSINGGLEIKGTALVKQMHEEEGNESAKHGSLGWCGKPAVKGGTGGWRCGATVLVNQCLVTLAFAGVEVNLVLFLKLVLRQTNEEAANTFSRWDGAMYLCSLLGAFLSDSYLGRYFTCVAFHVLLIIGLLAMSISTKILLLEPNGCGKIGELCNPHTPAQIAVFYVSIYLMAIGYGAPEPALVALGLEQFNEDDPEENQSKTNFYSYYYVARNLGCLVSETVLVYIESRGHWTLAFWVCTSCAIAAYMSLLSGTTRYRHFRPPASDPILRFSRVIVASFRKMSLEVPRNGEGLYETSEGDGSRKILHTDDYRFLDRAAIVTRDTDRTRSRGEIPNPWHLCTITQVEEVKCILRLTPIWLCTIMSSVIFIQMMALFVEQGAAMDTTVSGFHVPPASMTVFDIVSTSAFIVLYDKLIAPMFVKLTKRNPKPPTELQRIGIGLAIAVMALIIAGLVEQRRLRHAGTGETSSLSIFWQVPQYTLLGVSEAFMYVAQMEFFASQSPDGLKSIGIGLSMASSAIGCYAGSSLLTIVMDITTRNGGHGWVPPNLNDGHLDRYFFLSAMLTLVILSIFARYAKRYKSIVMEKRDGTDEVAEL